ncbi:MAG: hypothetical protein ACFFDP_10175 [Promethearchaeota archaeon]
MLFFRQIWLWLGPIGATVIIIVGLIVLHKDSSYSLNQIFSLSFILFGICWMISSLTEIIWIAGYPAVVLARNVSNIAGITATICFLLTGINVRYGTGIAFNPKVLITSFAIGACLSIVSIFDQVVLTEVDPLLGTQVIMGVPGIIALFVIPAILTLISVCIIISVSRKVDIPEKKQSLLLLAGGILFLTVGALLWAVQGFFLVIASYYGILALDLSILSTWLIGSLLCLRAFRKPPV